MTRRVTLRVEELGSRTLPSITPLVPLAAPAAAARAAVPVQTTLLGLGWGSYAVDPGLPDAGATFHFAGSAFVLGLGPATVQGSIHATGFVLTGQATGALTFATPHGVVTIAVQGPPQRGFSPLPPSFRYQIVGGTGAFSHLTGQGTLHLALLPPTSGAAPARGGFVLAMLPG